MRVAHPRGAGTCRPPGRPPAAREPPAITPTDLWATWARVATGSGAAGDPAPLLGRRALPLWLQRPREVAALARVVALRPAAEAAAEAGRLSGAFAELRARRARGEAPERLWPEALALAREATRRELGKEPYEVQLLGALAMARGELVEMGTGEGKSLVVLLAAVLGALEGLPVHVATANDYLAGRDASASAPALAALGLRAGHAQEGQAAGEKRAAYQAEVCYAQASTLAFDWLEDQRAQSRAQRCQRGLGLLLLDEADEILLDQARTPLLLSAPAPPRGGEERALLALARALAAELDPARHLRREGEAGGEAHGLSEAGMDLIERRFAELTAGASPWAEPAFLHALAQAIHARHGLTAEREYLAERGRVVLVNEASGRRLDHTRYRDGLMEALELEVGLDPRPPERTVGRTSYAALMSRYHRAAGASGSLAPAAAELRALYGKSVVVLPPHLPPARLDLPPRLFARSSLRDLAARLELVALAEAGRPALVVAADVRRLEELRRRLGSPWLLAAEVLQEQPALREELGRRMGAPGSESPVPPPLASGTGGWAALLAREPRARAALSALLEEHGLRGASALWRPLPEPRVLSARHTPDRAAEAAVIARAGEPAALTLASPMAGRGVDIPVSGEVLARGGLAVLLVDAAEGARQRTQVAGRTGRQGQRGAQQVLGSLEDRACGLLPAAERRALAERCAGEPELPAAAAAAALAEVEERGEERARAARRRLVALETAVARAARVMERRREELLDEPLPGALLQAWLSGAPVEPLRAALGEPPGSNRPVEAALTSLIERTGLGATEQQALARRVLLSCLDERWVEHLEELERLGEDAELVASARQSPEVELRCQAARAFARMNAELPRRALVAYVAALRALTAAG